MSGDEYCAEEFQMRPMMGLELHIGNNLGLFHSRKKPYARRRCRARGSRTMSGV